LLKGQTGKRNIEKICQQEVSTDYQRLHHFISHSEWDSDQVNQTIGLMNQKLLKAQSFGYIIDERSQAKKGIHSVGVGRQYCGSTGQVDNCQTGVYTVLTNQSITLPSNFRLFVPMEWITDSQRCKQAGLPSGIVSKSKVDLAIEMINQDRLRGVIPVWYGGDSLYGRAWKLTTFIEEDCQSHFVMDVPSDHQIYLADPDTEPAIRVRDYLKTISWDNQKIVCYEGQKKARVHVVDVYTKHTKLDRKGPRKRILIISKGLNKNDKIKYSLSNFALTEKNDATLVYMQRARFTIEQYFREANQVAGMGDYQVRSYRAWKHCQVLSMMLLQLLNKVREAIRKKKANLPVISMVRCISLILWKSPKYKTIALNIIKQHRTLLNTS
jgi:SRSO17 transposase